MRTYANTDNPESFTKEYDMRIVGTKYYGHDAAVCVLDFSRKEIFAISLERLTRIKHDETSVERLFNRLQINSAHILAHSFSAFSEADTCNETKANGIWSCKREELRRAIFKPRYVSDLSRINESEFIRVASADNSPEVHNLISLRHKIDDLKLNATTESVNKSIIEDQIASDLKKHHSTAVVKFYDHHLCHALAAYIPSRHFGNPTLVMTLDGQGDGHFSKLYLCDGDKIEVIGNSPVTRTASGHIASIGHIYSAFTEALGFRSNSEEGKVEALAAFGTVNHTLYEELRSATNIQGNSLRFNTINIARFLDSNAIRERTHSLEAADIAATVQNYLEDVVVDFLNGLDVSIDTDRLAISGGVAANIVMNLAIFERTRYRNIHICPYMGDEGTALGAALASAIEKRLDLDWIQFNTMPYWGPAYTRLEVIETLIKYENKIDFTDLGSDWATDAANAVAENAIVGIFQSKMEFGPRALGNRSILANPSDPSLRERLNVSIKRRPPWQPFCPVVLNNERNRLFTDSFDHKHMAIAFRVKSEHIDRIPSAVHVDGTARPQFVSEEDNTSLFRILTRLKELTGYGVAINTSFNLHGRTIVMSPSDAIDDFLDCNLDYLYIEGFRVSKKII
jgi:carbamoyltransferase